MYWEINNINKLVCWLELVDMKSVCKIVEFIEDNGISVLYELVRLE